MKINLEMADLTTNINSQVKDKNRIEKIVATKTKKMKAKVLQAIEDLKRKNKKLNSFAISKVANISYVTARKYWKQFEAGQAW